MVYHKFGPNDVFQNQIKTHPEQSFFIYRGGVYKNNRPRVTGSFVDSVPGDVPTGHANIYEINVDRASDQLIFPFITKDGSLSSFSTISTKDFNNNFQYGDTMTGSYPLSASISSSYFTAGAPSTSQPKREIRALKNTLNFHSKLSPHYAYSSSLGNKEEQEMRIAYVPSIFYGSSIKKGSISVKFYISGSLVGELVDDLRNGELRQNLPQDSNSGSVAGVALYDEGFIVLTGSWSISSTQDQYYNCGTPTDPRWIDALQIRPRCDDGLSSSILDSTSYRLDFKGTQPVPVKTMLAHAPKAQLNHSNNPTYLKFGSSSYAAVSGTTGYSENELVPIKNIASGTFSAPTASFQKITYISKIGIYDKEKNLIGVAKLASPVRKREQDEFTFKLKIDF